MALTVKGAAASSSQQGYAQKILTAGKQAGANTVALTASVYAGIYESGLGDDNAVNSSGYGGVLAGNTSTIIGDPSSDATTNNQANLFFKGGNGYESGGAIALSGSVSDPIEIAVRVEVPSIWPDNAYAHEGGYPGDAAAVAEAAAFVQAFGGGTLTGGTAGAGGTGATPGSTRSQSAFQIGDTSNPDEDYWTALNRLAQNAYWYCFSDGKILYIADGYAIMNAQPPVRVITRTDPAVIRLEGEWDNTTWSYTAHHKHRGKIQRKSTLAKVTSPTQITCELICKVDDVRAGQVVQVLGTGPMDGPWLIGDCKRSVFQVYSELTLVPALQPIPAMAPQTATAGSAAASAGTLTTGTSFPLHKADASSPSSWSDDQGVDISAPGGADLLAIGSGTVHYVSMTGFSNPGPPNIPVLQLAQPIKGHGFVYYGHADTGGHVTDGSTVNAGQKIGQVGFGIVGFSTGPHLEIGWAADASGQPAGSGTAADMHAFLSDAYQTAT